MRKQDGKDNLGGGEQGERVFLFVFCKVRDIAAKTEPRSNGKTMGERASERRVAAFFFSRPIPHHNIA